MMTIASLASRMFTFGATDEHSAEQLTVLSDLDGGPTSTTPSERLKTAAGVADLKKGAGGVSEADARRFLQKTNEERAAAGKLAWKKEKAAKQTALEQQRENEGSAARERSSAAVRELSPTPWHVDIATCSSSLHCFWL
jgi:hypothetical protein